MEDLESNTMQNPLLELMAARQGHFRFESGHHGDRWIDLELLCQRPTRVQPFAQDLAERLSVYNVDSVCGPLNEGTFLALMVASELDLEFSYAERLDHPENQSLYPVEYRIPTPLRDRVNGKRVAIVNDVINAGSAVRATFDDLVNCGAEPVAVGALLVLGSWAAGFTEEKGIGLTHLAQHSNHLWTPEECPLCESHMSLENPLTGRP